MATIFTEQFAQRPYWIDTANELAPMAYGNTELPRQVDVLVIGAGLTGSTAAGEIARGGRSVLVLDAKQPGSGASSRNAGMLGRNTKHSFLGLKQSAGLSAAVAYFRELREVFDYTRDFIAAENIACGYREGGRLVVANSEAHYRALVAEYDAREKYLGEPYVRVRDVPSQFGTRSYYGAVLLEDNVTLHPALYTRALIRRAMAAGAAFMADTPVLGVSRDGDRFEVHTRAGKVLARDVLIATNGYTGSLIPWISRRMMQLDSYFVATEPLPRERLDSLMRDFRHGIDTTRRPMNYRISADGTRFLFGGRSGEPLRRSLRAIGTDLHADMVGLFPQLKGVRLSHAWGGRCGVTWDMFPHVGMHDGMHYALGYCFSGLATAPHLGRRAAHKILGSPSFDTSYAERGFPYVPFYARLLDSEPARQVIRHYGRADHPRRPREFARVESA